MHAIRSFLARGLAAGALAAGVAGCGLSTTATNQSHTAVSHAVPASTASGRLSLVTEPAGGTAALRRLIGRAKHSIELTMYELADTRIESALSTAAHRGVAVRVLLNGGYYSEHETTNAPAYHYLAGHGVHVRYTPKFFALTHQKTLTVDGRESAILTGNLTSNYYSTTRDFDVLDAQHGDVRAIVSAFNADWAGHKTTASLGTGDLVWSPGSDTALLTLIHSAHRSLAIENEEMAYAPVTDALCAAAKRGVRVQITMTYETDWRSAFDQLSACHVGIHVDHGEHPIYVHAKVIIADGRTAFLGSENFSRTSLNYNRELGIITRARSVVRPVNSTLAKDFKQAEPWRP